MYKDKKQILSDIFPYIVTIIFLILSILLIINHEFWADEMRAWNISSSSESFKQLINYLRDSEGHPYLWSTLLYIISHYLVNNPETMKILHLTFSVTTVFLILKYAPFNKISKIMLVFSYFFFYEYSIISRNYAISILFMIIFCILYKDKYKNLISISIVLLIMGLGNIYSFIISIIFFFFLFFEIITERRNNKKRLNKIHFSIVFIVMMASIFLLYWQLGSQFTGTALTPSIFSTIRNNFFGEFFKIIKIIPESIIKSYLPIPSFNLNFWETNMIITFLSNINVSLVYLFGGILFFIPIFFLKKKVLFLYILANFSIAIVPAIIWKGYLRHIGHHFIILIVCIWISSLEENGSYLITRFGKFSKKLSVWFLIICLGFSLIGGIVAFYYDYRYPFTSAKKAADYIKSSYNNINDLLIIGYTFHPSETIAGYLNKELYFPDSLKENKFSRFLSWSKMHGGYDINLPIQSAYNFLLTGKEILLIITDASISDEEVLANNGLEKIEQDFSNSIVSWEHFKLYKFKNDIEDLSNWKELKKINALNFKENWKNFNNSEIKIINNNQIFIEALNDDPNFESNFQIPKISAKDKLFIKIDIEVDNACSLVVYFKRLNSQYNEEDTDTMSLSTGLNTVLIRIEDVNKLEGIRIDPVNIKQNCIINNIDFFQITRK